jgi:putative intracellular protease/amidase
MMAKNPAERHQTPAEVAEALAPLARSANRLSAVPPRTETPSGGMPVVASPVAQTRRRREAILLGIGSLLVLGAGLLGAWRVNQKPAGALAEGRPQETAPASVTGRRSPRLLLVVPPRDFFYPDVHTVLMQVPLYGVSCDIASTTLEECLPDAHSTLTPVPVVPDLLLNNARAVDYDAIYFCGGEGVAVFCPGGSSAAEVRRLIQEALSAGRTLAAMGTGVVVLAEADVLKGRRAACNPYGKPPGVHARRIEDHGAECAKEVVVEDGPFLTGRAPQDIQLFIRALLKRLGVEPRPPPGSSTADSP